MTIREFEYRKHFGTTDNWEQYIEYIKQRSKINELRRCEDLAVIRTTKGLLTFIALMTPVWLFAGLYLIGKAGYALLADRVIDFGYPLLFAVCLLIWLFRSWLRSKRLRKAGYNIEFERHIDTAEDLRLRLINTCHLAYDWDEEVSGLSTRLHVSYTNIASAILLCEITDNAEATKYFRVKLREFSRADFLDLGIQHEQYFARAHSQLIEKLNHALHRLNQGLTAQQKKNN